MNSEEILMRIGVDAEGVVTGMKRVGSLVKGQAALVMEDLKGMAGRWLGVFGAERALDSIKDRVLAINRAAEQTGMSTNMVQGIFNKLGEEGEDYEQILKPLTQLTGLTKNSKQYLGDLADAYVKLNTQEERNSMLMNSGIKNWQTLIPILKDGRAGIEALDRGNFFTKITPANIEALVSTWRGLKQETNVLTSFGANIAGIMTRINPVAVASRLLGTVLTVGQANSGSEAKDDLNFIWTGRNSKVQEAAAERQTALERENKVQEDGFTLAEKRAQVEEEITKMTEERGHMQDAINDRTKFSVDELAERARKLTGTDKLPRGLNSIYTVTPAMAAALGIQQIEDQAKLAQANGNAGLADRLQSQADRLRAQTPALKSGDRYPIAVTQEHIAHLDKNINQLTAKISKIPTPP